jgi:hypothetical protein
MFTHGMDNIHAGNIQIGVNSFKVALLATLPATTTQDTANVWGDISGNEAAGPGYTAGGAAIALTHSISTTGGVHRGQVMGPTNTQWLAATFSAVGAVVYRSDGASQYVAALIDFGGTKTSSGGTFQINWDSVNGVWYAGNTPV